MYLQITMSVKSPETIPAPKAPSPRTVQWALLGVGLAMAGSVVLIHSRNLGVDLTRFEWSFIGIGVSMALLGLALPYLPVGVSLFAGSSLVGFLLGLGVFAALQLDPVEEVQKLLLRAFPPKVGIWRYDPILGFANKPGEVGRFQKGEIDVQYTIDPLGFRVTPDPENSIGRVVFLGCSFTFGTGVEDEEPYPYILGRDFWPDHKMRNRAANAYGTAHAYLSLLQELEDPDPPVAVFYGWIPAHRSRNSIRRDWVEHLAGGWGLGANFFGVRELRKHPHLEVEGGRIVFKGVVGPEDGREDPPDLRDREIAVTTHCLAEMNRLCVERGIAFFFIDLPTDPGANPLEESGRIEPPDFLREAIQEHSIPLIDARDAHRGTLPGDYHPNPETHRAIAEKIAGDERVSTLFK